METKIKKWGNSLALRLPVGLADEMSLSENSLVKMSLVNSQLLIKPIPRVGNRLEELVSRINSDNSQSLSNWGRPVGRELW